MQLTFFPGSVSSPFSCLWSHQPCSKPSRAGHHLQEETYLPLTTVCSPHTSCPSTLTPLHFLPMPELSHLGVFAQARLSAKNTAPRVSLENSDVAFPRKPSQPSQCGWASQACHLHEGSPLSCSTGHPLLL